MTHSPSNPPATPTPAPPAPEAFADDSHLVGSAELANIIARRTGEPPVTTQTIANWQRAGRIPVARFDGQKRLFDPAVAVAAALANRSGKPHGGARSNAGRKPGPKAGPNRKTGTGRPRGRPRKQPAPEPVLPIRQAADARDAADAINARYHEDPNIRPPGALRIEDLANITAAELGALFGFVNPDAVGLSTAAYDRIERSAKHRETLRKEAIEQGRYVLAADVEHEWERVLGAVRRELTAAARDAAERIEPLAWISPEAADDLCRGLHKDGVPAATIDRVRQQLARPRDHATRIAAATQAIAERVAERLRD